jgi:hypothetical protein
MQSTKSHRRRIPCNQLILTSFSQEAHSDAIYVPLDEALAVRALANETCARWADVVQRTCEHRPSIQSHPRPSEAIRGHPMPIRCQSACHQV